MLETEPIDYAKMKNPPPWYEKPYRDGSEGELEGKKVSFLDDEEEPIPDSAVSRMGKIFALAITQLLALFGTGLCTLAILAPIPLAATVTLCLIGSGFILFAALAFERIYHSDTLPSA